MDKKTYFTESVKSNSFATYPFTEGYHDPEYPDYDFKGWKINGVTYTPPYTESMFKITSNTVIEAVWETKAGDTSYFIRNITPSTVPANYEETSMDYHATTITANFTKKVGNGSEEPCECYCCVYKKKLSDGSEVLEAYNNNSEKSTMLNVEITEDDAYLYKIYIGVDEMPNPSSHGDKHISAQTELTVTEYDIIFTQPEIVPGQKVEVTEGGSLLVQANFKERIRSSSSSEWSDSNCYASVAKRTLDGWERFYTVSEKHTSITYTIQNIESNVTDYRVVINPFGIASLHDSVKGKSFEVEVSGGDERLLYKVGVISDTHFGYATDVNEQQDLINALSVFNREGVSFVTHVGDVGENTSANRISGSGTQYGKGDYRVDADSDFYGTGFDGTDNSFYKIYKHNSNNLKLLTATGNHDSGWYRPYLNYYNKLKNDGTDNTEITNYSDENTKIIDKSKAWASFTPDNGITYYSSVQTDRTELDKLNYYYEPTGQNEIYVFLAIDYGAYENKWSNATGLYTQAFQKVSSKPSSMSSGASAAGYDVNIDGNYDYQYYDPNVLVWLEGILNRNQDKWVFVYMHHFMTNKVGNGGTEAYYTKNRVYPWATMQTVCYGNDTAETIKSADTLHYGSNTLTGIEFYYVKYLQQTYKKSIWLSGHTHTAWELNETVDKYINFCNKDFEINKPTEVTEKRYARKNNTPIADNLAWNVHIPSLSRPATLDGSLYNASEGAIIEVYNTKKIKIRQIVFKSENESSYRTSNYDRNELIINNDLSYDNPEENIEPVVLTNSYVESSSSLGSNEIGIVVHNATDESIYVSGKCKVVMNASSTTANNTWSVNDSGFVEQYLNFVAADCVESNGSHLYDNKVLVSAHGKTSMYKVNTQTFSNMNKYIYKGHSTEYLNHMTQLDKTAGAVTTFAGIYATDCNGSQAGGITHILPFESAPQLKNGNVYHFVIGKKYKPFKLIQNPNAYVNITNACTGQRFYPEHVYDYYSSSGWHTDENRDTPAP